MKESLEEGPKAGIRRVGSGSVVCNGGMRAFEMSRGSSEDFIVAVRPSSLDLL